MNKSDIETGLVVAGIIGGIILAIVGIVAVITWTVKSVWGC